jgi:hydroxypyruvate isomerase
VPKIAANISMLFPELPLLERLAAARKAGFDAVEIQFPYEFPLEDVAKAQANAGVEIVLINIPIGNAPKGERGLAVLPDRIDEFRNCVEQCRTYAEKLGAKRVNFLPGIAPEGADRAKARACLIDNLRYAAKELGKIGALPCIEGLNTRDIPGFFISRPAEIVALIEEVNTPNLALLYDLYHAQIMEGDLIPGLTRYKDRIGHIQFADTPGRFEPGTGELNYANILPAIDKAGYVGWAGAEYKPSTPRTEDSLGWFAPYRRK